MNSRYLHFSSKWYNNKEYEIVNKSNIPKNILEWNEKSWLKYHIEYCIEKNKYFVYPYFSLTTNFSDAGTHVEKNSTRMQVPMDMSIDKKYVFPNFNDKAIKYDAFFENIDLCNVLEIPSKDLEIDLYGAKEISNKKRTNEYQKLLEYLIHLAKEHKKASLTLEVNTKNEIAQEKRTVKGQI